MSSPNTADATKSATPVQQISMQQAQEYILENMFSRYQGISEEKDAMLREAYRKHYGREMMPLLAADEVRPVYLEGIPGNGKTKTHEGACRDFCKITGMRFIKNPTQEMVAAGFSENDFIMTVVELAGETSNKEVAGLMTKMKMEMADGTKREFMGHVKDWSIEATKMAGFGYILFDDFPTASHQVQNAMLGMLLNGKAATVIDYSDPDWKSKDLRSRQNASSVAMGLAGNRGERDGNKIYPITTAIADRVERYDVFDTVEAFKMRAIRDRADNISDAGIIGFLESDKSEFMKLAAPEQGMMGQSQTSRSWDAAMTRVRLIFHKNGGLDGIANMPAEKQIAVTQEIIHRAGGLLGVNVNHKLGGYYTQLFTGAAPLAHKTVVKGEVDVDAIKEKYGNGNTPANMNFGYSFSSALGMYASAEISKHFADDKSKGKKRLAELENVDSDLSKQLRKTVCNFASGVNQLSQGTLRSFAIDQFMRRLHSSVPELFFQNGNYNVPSIATTKILAYGFFVDNTNHMNPSYTDDISNSLSSMSGIAPGDWVLNQGNYKSSVDRALGVATP